MNFCRCENSKILRPRNLGNIKEILSEHECDSKKKSASRYWENFSNQSELFLISLISEISETVSVLSRYSVDEEEKRLPKLAKNDMISISPENDRTMPLFMPKNWDNLSFSADTTRRRPSESNFLPNISEPNSDLRRCF